MRTQSPPAGAQPLLKVVKHRDPLATASDSMNQTTTGLRDAAIERAMAGKKSGKGPQDPEFVRLKKTVSVWWAQRKDSFNRHSFWRPKFVLSSSKATIHFEPHPTELAVGSMAKVLDRVSRRCSRLPSPHCRGGLSCIHPKPSGCTVGFATWAAQYFLCSLPSHSQLPPPECAIIPALACCACNPQGRVTEWAYCGDRV